MILNYTLTYETAKQSISNANITLDNNNYIYDGTAKLPSITSVVLGQTLLTENVDYIIAAASSTINAGTYNIVIQGIGDYEGQASVSYTIQKADPSLSISPNSLNLVGVTGTHKDITVTYNGDGILNAIASSSGIVSVSIDQSTKIITVTSVSSGDIVLTIGAATGNNYNAATSISCSIHALAPNSTLSDSSNTPEVIKQVADEGIGRSIWSIGAVTQEISLQTFTCGSETVQVSPYNRAIIIGFDHNATYEGTGITFAFGYDANGTPVTLNSSSTYKQFKMMSPSSSSSQYPQYDFSTNWSNSTIRTVVCPAFFNALPSSWRNAITHTKKSYYGYLNTGGYCYDQCFILSVTEIGTEYRSPQDTDAAITYESNNQLQYEFYANGNSIVRYMSDGSTSYYWTRTPRSSSDSVRWYFYNAYYDKLISNAYTNDNRGIFLCFKIGGEDKTS